MAKAPTAPADPWRVVVNVAQIPKSGLHRDIEADAAARAAMAEMAGLRDISVARASFDLSLESDGRVHVAGRLTARIGQTCVVTLDPIESDIDEDIDLVFAPADEVEQLIDDLDEGAEEGDMPEPPEPIVNGMIDLGRLANDVLFLAVDPYPRKEGAVFEAPVLAADPEDHPFAALKTLKGGPKKPKSGAHEED
jgi:hypothetical protein